MRFEDSREKPGGWERCARLYYISKVQASDPDMRPPDVRGGGGERVRG